MAARAIQRVLNSPLLRREAYVGGLWTTSKDRQTFDVRNPSNRETICSVPDMTSEDVAMAIEKAYDVRKDWGGLLAKERCGIVRRWYEKVVEKHEELAYILTAEQGKPLNEARVEVSYAASFIEWFSEEGKRTFGDTIPTHAHNKRLMTIKQPVGVTALITPWNFPLAMITRKAAAALAAGCPVVVKPAEDTPLSALALANLAEEAGFPSGVYNTVTCSKDRVDSVGRELALSDKVAALSFTGSTVVGKLLMNLCSGSVKRISLELGGNAPFIVFDNADVEMAVSGAVAAKFRNTGQTCVSPNRFYVQEGIHDEFCRRLKESIECLIVNDGFADGAQQGPLINESAIEKVRRHVDDAVQKGAHVLCGAVPGPLGGSFYLPTLLTNVNSTMVMTSEETFGPIVGVAKFKTEEEAVAAANQTRYGLSGYIYSQSPSQIWRIAEALECGIVGVNEGLLSTEFAPFGGYKESGLGREGSKYGIEEYLEIKYICMGNV